MERQRFTPKLSAVHNKILKEKLHELEDDVRARTPEIQKDQMIKEFMKVVNTFRFRERFQLAFRILMRKL